MSRRSTLIRSSTSTPSASSIALKALVMYATGQMPQIRAVMSGRLGEGAAAQEGLEEAWRLVDLELDVLDLAVPDPHLHRALALDPGERLGADRPGLAVLSHRPRAARSRP